VLSDAGYRPYSVAILGFSYINIEKLASLLEDYQKFQAVVFTSQRSVEATDLVLKKFEGIVC